MIGSYRRLLANRGVPHMMLVDLFVKLGTPVLSLALLLATVDTLGSYAAGGVVLSGHALALAGCAPIGGRLADRIGARRTLVGYLIAHTLAYTLLLLTLLVRTPTATVVGTAALLGATSPPAAAIIRGAWPRLLPATLLPGAYAIGNAINELMFIAGPVLVTALMLVMPARNVIATAGAAVLVGAALLIASRTVRDAPLPTRPAEHSPARNWTARLAGPLTHRPTLVLLTAASCATFSFGCLRIGTVASSTAFGSPSSAGMLMGLLSAGSLAGVLVYGARQWHLSSRRLLILLCLADAAGMLATAIAPNLLTTATLIALVGLLTGPRDTLQQTMLGASASDRGRTEVFAWLNTFMWTGYGLGTAIAGNLTNPREDGTTAFTAAAAVALLGAALVTALHRPTPDTSRPAPQQQNEHDARQPA